MSLAGEEPRSSESPSRSAEPRKKPNVIPAQTKRGRPIPPPIDTQMPMSSPPHAGVVPHHGAGQQLPPGASNSTLFVPTSGMAPGGAVGMDGKGVPGIGGVMPHTPKKKYFFMPPMPKKKKKNEKPLAEDIPQHMRAYRISTRMELERDLEHDVELLVPDNIKNQTDATNSVLRSQERIGHLGFAVPWFAVSFSRWAPLRELSCDEDPEYDDWSEFFTRLKYGIGMYLDLAYHESITVLVLIVLHFSHQYATGEDDVKMSNGKEERDVLVDETMVGLFTGVLAFTLVFRINLAYARWWDSRKACDSFAAKLYNVMIAATSFDQFTKSNAKSRAIFRCRVAGYLSLLHREAMAELGGIHDLPCLGGKLMDKNHVSQYVGRADTAARNGVGQCYVWLVMLLCGRFLGHAVAGPILARANSLADEALSDYHAAMVVRSTPFPLAFVRMLDFALFLVKIIIPLVVHQTGLPLHWGIPLVCFCVYGFFGIGRVAIELEQPYGSDYYDHPLENWQLDFDICLFDVLHRFGYDSPALDCALQRKHDPSGDSIEEMSQAAQRCADKSWQFGTTLRVRKNYEAKHPQAALRDSAKRDLFAGSFTALRGIGGNGGGGVAAPAIPVGASMINHVGTPLGDSTGFADDMDDDAQDYASDLGAETDSPDDDVSKNVHHISVSANSTVGSRDMEEGSDEKQGVTKKSGVTSIKELNSNHAADFVSQNLSDHINAQVQRHAPKTPNKRNPRQDQVQVQTSQRQDKRPGGRSVVRVDVSLPGVVDEDRQEERPEVVLGAKKT
ncbi:unnamed protein product [Amoebophrya sp. A25]|nr:unnamed protein product [Amoebophrya sp. A25]|eukprot:GSA25T00001548001.1